ncbi:MAG TPA: DNA helicase RecQ, partial [Caldithrix sp.]|nr:DNA helicase RecQ [Caldithrix sp.]
KEPEFGSLKLTEKAREVLSGKEKFFGTLQEEPPKPATRTDTYRDYDKTLFDLLRAKRKQLADQANVPPYVIFSDKSLVEMAVFYPQSRDTFVTMHGVGSAKLEKYGDIFLEIIQRYCSEHRISERTKYTVKSRMTAKLRPLSKPRHVEVGEAYNRGSSVTDLVAKYGVKQSTILDHLYRFYREGNPLKNGSVLSLSSLPQNQQTKVLEAFSRLGTEMLRPVFDKLNGEVSFEELKILRLYYISLQR